MHVQYHARRLSHRLLLSFAQLVLCSISISISSTTGAVVSAATATKQTQMQRQTLSSRSAPCRLNCANGGYCKYTGIDEDQLAYDIQSGQLVQKCVCPPGFVGMGCEVPSPCEEQEQQQEQQDTQCDYCTAVADEMSKFAGMMCRKTYTEYCNRASASSDFCTNGGKCKAGLLAALFAPGNTSANSQFADIGCVCNPAFYGPHCEFLKLRHHVDDNLHRLDPEPLTTASLVWGTSSTSSTTATTRDSESSNNSSDISISNTINSTSSNITGTSERNNNHDAANIFSMNMLFAAVASFLTVVAGSVTIRRCLDQREANKRHHRHTMPYAGSKIYRNGGGRDEDRAVEFALLTRAGRNII
jgi:hypothetical protein